MATQKDEYRGSATSVTARSFACEPRLNLDAELFKQDFDREPFGFAHNLNILDLFKIDSLLGLAEKFSGSPRDYFIAGGAPTAGTNFYSVPNGGFEPRQAIEDLHDEAQPPTHRFGDRGHVEMVVAPRRRRRADEDAVDEEGAGHLLQPEPGMADRAREHIAEHRDSEPSQSNAAHDHRDGFDDVEGGPLEVALRGQDQRAGRAHRILTARGQGRASSGD